MSNDPPIPPVPPPSEDPKGDGEDGPEIPDDELGGIVEYGMAPGGLESWDDLFVEYKPAAGLQRPDIEPFNPEKIREDVRRWIAFALVALFVFSVVAPWVSLWVGRPDVKTVQSVFPIVTGQVVGLLGAVTGFYFGEKAAEQRTVAQQSATKN
jgi:hypothetical protein